MMFCEQIKNFNSLSKSLLLIIFFSRHATQQILVVETFFCVKPTVNTFCISNLAWVSQTIHKYEIEVYRWLGLRLLPLATFLTNCIIIDCVWTLLGKRRWLGTTETLQEEEEEEETLNSNTKNNTTYYRGRITFENFILETLVQRKII